jgi:hypothetical protein
MDATAHFQEPCEILRLVPAGATLTASGIGDELIDYQR